MKVIGAIVILAILVLLLDKFHSKLPPPFPQIHKMWTAFSHTLGKIMSSIILTILWIIAFGPYAIIFKLNRKKPLTDSYWIDTEPNQDLRHQF